MRTLSLRQAAEATGKSKSTISKALTSGKITYMSKDETGYKIEPSELFRVYPPKPVEADTGGHEETPISTGGHPQETPHNAREIDILRELADERKEAIEDMKYRLADAEERAKKAEERLHQAHQQARAEREQIRLLLPPPPAPEMDTGRELITTPEPEQQTQARRRRWWQRKEKAKA